jgi:alanine racemase
MSYAIEQLTALMGARRMGSAPAVVSRLLTDSRSLWFPEETLFFALTGQHGDGHAYVDDLYRRGVRSFVVSRLPDVLHDDANYLVVDDTLVALQRLAECHRQTFGGPVVGITGSNGKTVVKEWLYQLLSPDRIVTRSPRSYNSQIGVPLSAWLIGEQTELAILEAGISQPGEMRRLQPIVRPTIGVLTNIGGAHQENFASMHEKCMEKLALFKDCDILIYNGDDELISDCVSRRLLAVREIAWSRRDSERPLFIGAVEKHTSDTLVTYRYLGYEGRYTLPFIDDASIENSLHCLAVCLYLMMDPAVIAERMSQLEPVAMRLQVMEGVRDCTLINDSYNSDLASLDIALDFMARRPDAAGRERMLILSDIEQTGQLARQLYKRVEHLMESRGITRLVGIGPEISAYFSRKEKRVNGEKLGAFGAIDNYQLSIINSGAAKSLNPSPLTPHLSVYPDTEAFLESDELKELHSQVILIKGARRFGFDRIADALTLRVHETTLEVNLSAIVDNLNYYRHFLTPATRMVCMVKAFAYGAGFYEIAKTLQDHGVDYLAVAVADEGRQLREAGITTGILVMNPERSALDVITHYHLEPEIYSFSLLEEMIHACELSGITGYPVHIKIDTGMSRLGFSPDDMPRLIARLHRQTAVVPRSIFSHFACSDVPTPEGDAFSRLQMERFDRAADALRAVFGDALLRHICNSAAIPRFPDHHYEMVRLGLGLYGIDPVDGHSLHCISTLRTTILQIRDVVPPETVGYSRRGVLSRPSRIAAIPIGYADGLNRHLGNRRGHCLVHGQPAPYVGNICMDVAMIDVTDIPDCHEGDSVEIFGPNLPVTQLAQWLDTIPYEVLTSVSTRVKRIYFTE